MKANNSHPSNPGATEMIETKVYIKIVCRKSTKERYKITKKYINV